VVAGCWDIGTGMLCYEYRGFCGTGKGLLEVLEGFVACSRDSLGRLHAWHLSRLWASVFSSSRKSVPNA